MRNKPSYNSGRKDKPTGYKKDGAGSDRDKGGKSYDRPKPRRKEEDGDRKPYGERAPRSFDREQKGDKPYKKPFEKREGFKKDDRSDRPRRFEEGDKPKRSYEKREGFKRDDRSTDRPRRFEEGDKPKRSYEKREGFKRDDRSTDRPKRFEEGDKPKRSYEKREGFKRDDRSTDRPRRFEDGDKPKRSYEKREGFKRDDRSTDRPRRFEDSDKPKRSFEKKEGFKKDFSDRPKRFEDGDKPKRSFEKKEGFKKDDASKRFRDDKKTFNKEEGFKSADDKPKFSIKKPEQNDSFDKPYPLGTRKVSGPFRKKFAEEQSAKTSGEAPVAKEGRKKELSADKEMTLNKYIAHSGECSRREAADLVKQGKVKVNGQLMLDPGYRVQPEDFVSIAGKKLTPQKHKIYILLNKPKGYLTTTDDPQGRRTVMELVEGVEDARLYPVGRLDMDTTGLLLLTNDGDLAQKLSHPSYEIKKVYQVTLDKPLTKTDFGKIVNGLELEDGPVHVDELAYLESKNELGLEIHSGRNRIVRRIFESLGYEVEKLDRVMYAGLTKKNLPRSKWRALTDREIIVLKHFKQ